jgi:hypothetical protein
MRLGSVAVFTLVVTAPVTAQDYDLLLSAGRVIDVKNRVDAIRAAGSRRCWPTSLHRERARPSMSTGCW